MKRKLQILFGAMAILLWGCFAPVEEPEPTPNDPSEEEVEQGGEQEGEQEEQNKEGVLKAISVEKSAYVLDFSDEATVYLLLDEPTAVIKAEEISLVGADDDVAPEQIVIRKSEQSEVGRWRLFLYYTNADAQFSEVLRVRVSQGEQNFYSQTFSLQSRNMEFQMQSLRFLREDNPSLSSDVYMVYDHTTKTFKGATEDPLADMRLVARFESNVPAVVDGEVQQSGVSVVDFSNEVVYVVGSAEFKVKLTNFTGLPIISINTDDRGAVTSKEVWKSAKITIVGNGLFDDLAETVVNIRGRGNTTWGWPKKPYALKFEKKTSVLGMPKHKRWVLLANAMDKTMLRNRMAFKIAQQTSLAWTPRNEYAEVFLNGKHIGCYLIAEQVKVDKERVNITEMTTSDNSGEALTGGYLFELDFHFDNEYQWRSSRNIPFAIKSPDEDELTTTQFQWAKDYIAEVEEVLYSTDYLSPEKGYVNYIDQQSFVDYWMVYEICLNHELGNPGSVYMYKDRGGKLTAGPVWDFDWGTFSYKVSTSAKGRIYLDGVLWYGRLFKDRAMKTLAKERWAAIYPRLLSLVEFIDHEEEYLALSAKRNFALWNPQDTGGVNGDELLPYEEAVARLRTIYAERIADLDAAFAAW